MISNYFQWPWWIQQEIFHRLNITHWQQLNQLSNSKNYYWQWIINQYKKSIPLTKILGIKYFYDYKLINRNVLDPRYDSEVIFDVINYWNSINFLPLNVLELGAGSGCLSISIHKKYNNNITLGEIDPHAIKTLRRNLKLNQCNKYNIIQTNWWQNIKKTYDVLITNPPYLSLSEMINGDHSLKYDPWISLYGGYDGLRDYNKIFQKAKNFITKYMVVEICSNKLNEIVFLANTYNWHVEQTFYDIHGKPRMILFYYQ